MYAFHPAAEETIQQGQDNRNYGDGNRDSKRVSDRNRRSGHIPLDSMYDRCGHTDDCIY